MAQAAVTFDSLMKELKAGKYRPVYYLMGEEPYYIDKIADWIADNALKPEERDFNQRVLFGSDVTAAQIADAARGYPMMAERQVIIVKEVQNLKNTEALEKYLKNPMPTTVLVMCHKNGKIDGRKREYVRLMQTAGVIFESKKVQERDLEPFIINYLKARQTTIDQKSAQIIAESIGADLSRLTGELEKLIIGLPDDNRVVTPQIVEDKIGVSKDFNGFELRNAIVNRDIFKANQIVEYFKNNPKSGSVYLLIPLLFSYFQNLMVAFYCPNRRSQEAVAQWLELRSPWAAREYVTGMQNYTGGKVYQILNKIREIDAKSKGLDNPSTDAGELMQELVFFILH